MEISKKNKIQFEKDDFLLKNICVVSMGFMTGLLFFELYRRVLSPLNQVVEKSDLLPYMLLILVVIGSSIIYNFILVHLNIIQYINKCNKIVSIIIGGLIIIGMSALLLHSYMTELNLADAPSGTKLQYHGCNMLSVMLMGCAFILIVYIIENCKGESTNANKLYFWAFVIVIAVLNAYILYTPNVFSAFYNVYHADAYYNSIYRAMQGVPRTSVDTGIYGCYGLVLAPLVLLLGGTISSFYIAMGIVGAISIFCMAYAINTLVKTPIIKVIGVAALPIMLLSIQWGVYTQLNPHRLLFPSIMIAFMTYVGKNNKDKLKWTIIGYVVSMFSIIWSTEIGIICTLTWAAFTLYKSLIKYNLIQLKLYRDILINILLSLASFAIALATVGVINILMGGTWISVNDFMFPLMSKKYMVDALVIKLPEILASWIFVTALFSIFLIHSIMKTKLSPLRNAVTGKDGVFFGLAVLGIGQITYYINRAVYANITVCYYIVILLLCILADWSYRNYKLEKHTDLIHNIFRAASYMILSFLIIIILGGISNSFSVENSKSELNLRQYDIVTAFTEELKTGVPKDTKAIGTGVVELYSCLGWDCGYYPIDFSDLAALPAAADYINNELANLDEPVLINAKSLEDLNSYSQDSNKKFFDRYKLEKTFNFYQEQYDYYIPKNN